MEERSEKILGIIIKEYTQNSEPVGSQLLSEKYNLDISPATIRMEMHSLEKQGYLKQPHTSAGRVPTGRAYRYFVDRLEAKENLGSAPEANPGLKSLDQKRVDHSLRETNDPRLVTQQIAQVIAQISDNLAISGILDTGEFYKTGLSGLLDHPEFQEFQAIRQVTDLVDHFEDYIDRLTKKFDAPMEVFIGSEVPLRRLSGGTVLISRYPLPGGMRGLAAMVGPVRMNYQKNIALMKYITQVMGRGTF